MKRTARLARAALVALASLCAGGCEETLHPRVQVEPLRASPLNDDHVVGVLASQLRAAPSAAATPSVPEPTRGPWIEITSPHFILRTDEDVVLAHATMAELERSYAVLGAAVGTPRAVAATTPVEVVLFATRKEYEAFERFSSRACFRPAVGDDIDGLPQIFAHGRLTGADAEPLRHELTHLFVSRALGGAPRWLNEGLAELYSTVNAHDGVVDVGAAPAHIGLTRGDWHTAMTPRGQRVFVPVSAVPAPSSTRRAPQDEWLLPKTASTAQLERQTALYLGAYALVHLLATGAPASRARFDELLRGIAAGERGEVAWRRIFGDSDSEIDDAFARHIVTTHWDVTAKPYAPAAEVAAAALAVRPMSLIDETVLGLRVAAPWSPVVAKTLMSVVDRQIARGPWSPELLMWHALLSERAGEHARAEAEIEGGLATRPDDPRLLFAYAKIELASELTKPDPAVRAKLAKLGARLETTAKSAPALALVANVMLSQRKVDRAVESARAATERDPACGHCFRTLAAALLARGDARAALQAEQRSVSSYAHTSVPVEVADELAKFEDAARRAPSATPSPKGAAPTPVKPQKPGDTYD